MIEGKLFYEILVNHGIAFFAGVPDSSLKDFCTYITDAIPHNQHVIAANEGNAISTAAGYHLATGNIGAVYLQNSGFGNCVNPCAAAPRTFRGHC